MKVILSIEIRKRQNPEFQKTKKLKWSVHFVAKNVLHTADQRYLGAKCASCGLEGVFIPREDLRHDFLGF